MVLPHCSFPSPPTLHPRWSFPLLIGSPIPRAPAAILALHPGTLTPLSHVPLKIPSARSARVLDGTRLVCSVRL